MTHICVHFELFERVLQVVDDRNNLYLRPSKSFFQNSLIFQVMFGVVKLIIRLNNVMSLAAIVLMVVFTELLRAQG
jgi:hypothetical protein